MTVMFKPPSLDRSDESLADLFRIGAADDPLWAKIRTRQVRYLSQHLPFNIGMILINGAVVLAALGDRIDPPVIGMWLLLTLSMMAIWVTRVVLSRRPDRRWKATPDNIRRIIIESAVLGLGWGMLFLSVLPVLPSDLGILAVALAMAVIGCSAFASAIFPLSAMAGTAPMVLGVLGGILMAGWAWADLAAVVLASFVFVLLRSNLMATSQFLVFTRTQESLRGHEEMVRLLLAEFETGSHDWLFEFDRNGHLVSASSRLADAARAPVEALLGLPWTHFLRDIETAAPLFACVRRALPFRDHLLKVEIAGETRWWSVSGTPVRDARGRLAGYRGIGSDVTDRQLSARRIADLATFDTLTGLVNRRVIHSAVEEGLRASDGVMLLFIDLDRFKAVNDTLGHAGGDRLLLEVARRLREAAGPHALIGRLGGDEFALVLRGVTVEAAVQAGERIIARLSEPYRINGSEVLIGASIGLASGPADGDSVEALMRAADLALYDVKGKGRGSVRCYDRELHRQVENRRSLELDLRNALGAGQIRLAYQPVIDAQDERIVGFEALMRWRHPVQGEIPPSVFIPIAEESGVIGKLGEWALNEACRVAAGWPAAIRISVNLSPAQFRDPNLAQTIEQTLRRWKLPPARLELELTESLFLDEHAQTGQTLGQLRALGVGFALDDFGTGYASLGYLQKINFTRIKIDRSFVRAAIADGGESVAIIQAIVALAEQLGLETTAEGTETRAEFEAMRRLGCGQVQGYYFGRPMPAEDATRMLDRRRPLIELREEEEAEVTPPGAPLPPRPAAARAQSQKAAEPASPPVL